MVRLSSVFRAGGHRAADHNIQMDEAMQKQEQQIRQMKENLERQSAARTAELQQSYDLLKQYSNYLQNLLEEDRTRLALEIHDELGQALTGLKIDLYQINKQLLPDQSAIQQRITDSVRLIDQTIGTMRRICSELRPGILDDLGLLAALEWLFARFQEQTDIEIFLNLEPADLDIPKELHTGIFRIVEEILARILRHSQASQAWMTLAQQDGHIQLDMRDNGHDFDSEVVSTRSLGWISIRERASQLGGNAVIQSNLDTGIQVCVTIPLQSSGTGRSVIV